MNHEKREGLWKCEHQPQGESRDDEEWGHQQKLKYQGDWNYDKGAAFLNQEHQLKWQYQPRWGFQGDEEWEYHQNVIVRGSTSCAGSSRLTITMRRNDVSRRGSTGFTTTSRRSSSNSTAKPELEDEGAETHVDIEIEPFKIWWRKKVVAPEAQGQCEIEGSNEGDLSVISRDIIFNREIKVLHGPQKHVYSES